MTPKEHTILEDIIGKLNQSVKQWKFYTEHTRWVDDGKGGSYDCPLEWKLAQARLNTALLIKQELEKP